MFLHDRTLMSSHEGQNTALLVGNSGGLRYFEFCVLLTVGAALQSSAGQSCGDKFQTLLLRAISRFPPCSSLVMALNSAFIASSQSHAGYVEVVFVKRIQLAFVFHCNLALVVGRQRVDLCFQRGQPGGRI